MPSLVEARRASLAESDTLFTHPQPYIYGIYTVFLAGKFPNYTFIYGVYDRFWPNLHFLAVVAAAAAAGAADVAPPCLAVP